MKILSKIILGLVLCSCDVTGTDSGCVIEYIIRSEMEVPVRFKLKARCAYDAVVFYTDSIYKPGDTLYLTKLRP